MGNRKEQFIADWLEINWPKFVAGEFEDNHGRVLTIADAMDLTALEGEQLDAAFRNGACATHDAIEVIAKAFLVSVAADEAWRDHVAAEEEMQRDMLWERIEMREHHLDMKGSAK